MPARHLKNLLTRAWTYASLCLVRQKTTRCSKSVKALWVTGQGNIGSKYRWPGAASHFACPPSVFDKAVMGTEL